MENKEKEAKYKFCKSCGKKINEEEDFCSKCGQKVGEETKPNNTKKCKKCKEEINFKAKKCPNCGATQGMPVWAVILIVFLSFIVIVGVFSGDEELNSEQNDRYNHSESNGNSSDNSNKKEEKSESVDPTANWTIEQKNCYEHALRYLDTNSFSKKGLIEQLEFEKYPKNIAEFAVSKVEENNLVNWDEQAELKAKTYLEYSSFSKQSLIEQLEFEGFTTMQAQKAVEKVYK